MTEDNPSFRCGYVAIVGEPNVGKSTLLNAFLGQKLSIVTRKPQTTRQRVLGILNRERTQIVFLDTPGLLDPQYLLQEKMLESARAALSDADVVLALTEVRKGTELHPRVEEELSRPSASGAVRILVINKVDTVHRDEVLPLIGHFAKRGLFAEIVPVSAAKQENLDRLLSVIVEALPIHPPYYPEDVLSDTPERFFVAELIRETVFEHFREEIPYSTAVEIREFKEREAGAAYILADIVVERKSQKGILIGRKGESLKSVGVGARAKIEKFLNRPVYLELFVKIGKEWRASERWLNKLGYTRRG
jgi:GTP-binding protein Era